MFLEKLKNNKALDIGFIGVCIICILVTVVCGQFDMFISGFAKYEVEQIVEMAELYALVDSVEVANSRNGVLKVNELQAKAVFKKEVEEAIGVGKEGSYVQDFKILSVSITYNKNKESFVDRQNRPYISMKAIVQLKAKNFFPHNNPKPMLLNVESRIMLHTA